MMDPDPLTALAAMAGVTRRIGRIFCAVESRAARNAAVDFLSRTLLALYACWGHANVGAPPAYERESERVARRQLTIGETAECIERVQNLPAPDPVAHAQALLERAAEIHG